jgi:hypothetical protein
MRAKPGVDVDAAGVAADTAYPLDGRSLLPILRDAEQPFDRPMYWRMNHRGQRVFREGEWKYLRVDGHDYLLNLRLDERERTASRARQYCANEQTTTRRKPGGRSAFYLFMTQLPCSNSARVVGKLRLVDLENIGQPIDHQFLTQGWVVMLAMLCTRLFF